MGIYNRPDADPPTTATIGLLHIPKNAGEEAEMTMTPCYAFAQRCNSTEAADDN
jgi:hypothetical protein